jgi:ubiquinone/menaquinone biosynthesis C-methylase UbiE
VLEVGCGTGTTALRLADGVGEIVASDLSGAMIALAEGKARAAGAGNVRFVRAAVADAPREADGFDAVLAFHVLHLVDDLPAALGALAARLRPGGTLISKTVCLGETGWPIRVLIRAMRAVGLAPPVASLTLDGLESAIEAAGFEIVETGLFPERPPNRFVVARKV